MGYCTKCGGELTPGAGFCRGCGAPTGAAPAAPAASASMDEDTSLFIGKNQDYFHSLITAALQDSRRLAEKRGRCFSCIVGREEQKLP